MCNCDLCEKQHHEKSLEFFKALLLTMKERLKILICLFVIFAFPNIQKTN